LYRPFKNAIILDFFKSNCFQASAIEINSLSSLVSILYTFIEYLPDHTNHAASLAVVLILYTSVGKSVVLLFIIQNVCN
jgi:hypothetical protein